MIIRRMTLSSTLVIDYDIVETGLYSTIYMHSMEYELILKLA